MRVLQIYSGNLYGGIERMLVTFARTHSVVPELEHEFALSFPGRLADELAAAGAAVHPLGAVRASRPHTLLSARRALRRVLRAGNYDSAICHGAWPHALFARTVRNGGLPLAFWAHNPADGRHWTERWALRVKPELLLCNSNFTLGSMAKFWPSVPARVIYCPVEAPPKAEPAEMRASIHAELNTPLSAPVIVQVSRMEPWKGQAVLLSALDQLSDRSDWHCWIVGGAQRPQEREYQRGLMAHAVANGSTGRIHFLGERSDVGRLLAAADIFCQPNLLPEPFGISLVEALYAELPVVTSAMGGATEIVDASCGLLTPPEDAASLAEALRSLLENAERRTALGAAGPARARQLSDPAQQVGLLHSTLSDHFGSGGHQVAEAR
jgi:glycosyltransferase involved in cell wall biosynthesis